MARPAPLLASAPAAVLALASALSEVNRLFCYLFIFASCFFNCSAMEIHQVLDWVLGFLVYKWVLGSVLVVELATDLGMA